MLRWFGYVESARLATARSLQSEIQQVPQVADTIGNAKSRAQRGKLFQFASNGF